MSERKISGIMKELGIRSKYGRKRAKNVYTSNETKKYIHENLFAKLNYKERQNMEIWSMDFTEEEIKGKKIYFIPLMELVMEHGDYENKKNIGV